HFTQVVWKGTTELGMGKAKSTEGNVIVVGSYRPPGNMKGAFGQNVLPTK
ncbi:Golgi-associated plant pathogenesis-related protein 1, partial [Biomphalaria glabrata]